MSGLPARHPAAGTRRPGPIGSGRRSLVGVMGAALLVGIGLTASPAPAAAQTRADSAAVLLDAARRLAAEGQAEVAQTLYRFVVERYGGTTPAEEAARLLAAGGPERDGRVELQVWGTLYGLWLGVGVPLAAGVDDPEPYGLGLLLGGPAGFFASRAYARSRPLTVGQARAITLGGTWGSWQGLGWALVADVGQDGRTVCPDPQFPDNCFTNDGDATEEVVAGVIAGGLVGIATGAILARKPISQGVASTANFGALWGTWFGLAAGVLLDREDDDLLAATLIGGDAGLLATGLLAPEWDLTRERARLISIAGVLGGLAGAGIDLLIQPDDEKVAIAIPLIGSIAGLVLGASTTRDRAASGGVRDDSSPAGGNGLPMPALLRVGDATGGTRLVPGLTFAVRF